MYGTFTSWLMVYLLGENEVRSSGASARLMTLSVLEVHLLVTEYTVTMTVHLYQPPSVIA